MWRSRIYYSNAVGGSWLLPPERLSGYKLSLGDNNEMAQDMPALVSVGSDLYIAWREKAKGETRRGIYVRQRDASTGNWVPEGNPSDANVMGYRISNGRAMSRITSGTGPKKRRMPNRARDVWSTFGT